MFKIFLCDSDETILKKYAKLIQGVADKHNLTIKLFAFTSGEQLLKQLETVAEIPDITYVMDVLKNSLNNIKVAKAIRKLGYSTEIIFLSNSTEHIFESFEVKPTQYLLKGEVSVAQFEQTFLKATKLREKNKKELEQWIVKIKTAVHVIPTEEISYLKTKYRKITIYYSEKKELTYYDRMYNIESKLKNKRFIRVNRECVVNVQYIRSLKRSEVGLWDGTMLKVGNIYLEPLRLALREYVEETNMLLV